MFTRVRKMIQCASNENISSLLNYEEAVKTLNTLQTTGFMLHKDKASDPKKLNSLQDTTKYLIRSGVSLEQLDSLSVIHVAGTKGKGSTCAFLESILQKHGFRTGFYSSPHIITVRERIRLNAEPISKTKFTHYFWQVYNVLNQMKESSDDLPTYFKFLTIVMFHVFLKEDIDVAIIEVGIGGELDCTNIVRNSVCTGITSLGLDHTHVLGEDIESIAFQKSGIFKPGAPAFTVPQSDNAMSVLRDRARDKNCTLNIVPNIDTYPWNKSVPLLGIRSSVQNNNASLAIQLASSWIMRYNICRNNYSNAPKFTEEGEMNTDAANKSNNNKWKDMNDNESKKMIKLCYSKIAEALECCRWPGRTQYLPADTMDFYIDGAHTIESIESCVLWFRNMTQSLGKRRPRYLIFNTTGIRDSSKLLSPLKKVEFTRVFFVPNVSGLTENAEQANFMTNLDNQMERCHHHVQIWGENSIAVNSVYESLKIIEGEKSPENSERHKPQVLVTGSLHLVGACLSIVDPDLTLSMK